MAAQTKNLTTGGVKKVIAQYTLPLFLSQLFQQLYNSVDSLIVGNFLGKQALAAVASSGSLIFLLVSFATGISLGAGVVISRYFGAGERDKVLRAMHTDAAFGLVLGAALTAAGVLLSPLILRLMGTAPDVMSDSVSYFRWYFAGGIPLVLYNFLCGIMNALGDSRHPLYYLIFSSLLNIALDLLFVGVLRFGVGSAAVATSLSQAISMILCLRLLTRRDAEFRLSLKKLRFHRDMLGEIVKNGVPSGVQNSVIAFANVLVQTNINSFGSDAMAACGAYSKLEGFAFLPITSFSMALTTFIGQNLGARQFDRAKRGARFGIVASLAIAELIGAALFAFAPQLIGIFSGDARVVAIGAQQARIEALFFFLLSFSHCIAGICRGAGKATVPMVVMLSVWCVLRIIYITIIMGVAHEIKFLFLAYPMTWAISSVIFLIYYLRSDWVHSYERQERLALNDN